MHHQSPAMLGPFLALCCFLSRRWHFLRVCDRHVLRAGLIDPADHRSGDLEHPDGQILQITGDRSNSIWLLTTNLMIYYYALLIKESSILVSSLCLPVTAKTLHVR